MKIKTKEQILEKSLLLFNEKGLENVSTRDIAKEVGIAQGNLCYHYPTKQEVVEGLYYKFLAEFDTLFAKIKDFKDTNFEAFFKTTFLILKLLNKYKFFTFNFVEISRNYTKISESFIELQKKKKLQFSTFHKLLIMQGFMKKETYRGLYDTILLQSNIISNFCFSEGEILLKNNDTEEEKLVKYTETLALLIYPYLTEKGKLEFLLNWKDVFAYELFS